jgi:hypothetical protein
LRRPEPGRALARQAPLGHRAEAREALPLPSVFHPCRKGGFAGCLTRPPAEVATTMPRLNRHLLRSRRFWDPSIAVPRGVRPEKRRTCPKKRAPDRGVLQVRPEKRRTCAKKRVAKGG